MQAFADFSDNLLGGLILVGLSLTVGSIVFGAIVLQPWRRHVPTAVLHRFFGLLVLGSIGLAAAQAAQIALKLLLLADYLGPGSAATFFETTQGRAGLARTLLALVPAALARGLARRPQSRARWSATLLAALALLVSGAWLVHAAGRLESRGLLMTLTVLHQVGATIWVGGLIQIVGLAALCRRDSEARAVWPTAVSRFSGLALASVVLLIAPVLPLARVYVATWKGLFGSGYGSLILTKAFLMLAALALAAFNFGAVRRWRGHGESLELRERVPRLLEAEGLIAVVLLFAAASLSSQPPSVDSRAEQATVPEVLEVFRPKLPDLRTPSIESMSIDPSDPYAVAGGERTAAAYSWSNFSHNVSGLFLLAMGVVALAGWLLGVSWARHWPLGFAALAVFIFLRTSANDQTWPFGDKSFWENAFGEAEVLQHRLAAFLALAIGLLEWRARAGGSRTRLPYVFPMLAAAGGILLLTHSHAAFEAKSSFLVQVTHTVMGALAVVMAATRLLELRLAPPASRIAGTLSTVAMVLIALVLVFYREANVVVSDVALR
ncbi:MAG: copper resistance protein [Deltaproteobacteria bacterium]|nr:copper resistance protein [Deltaproteobacteria bacterium]